jgi:biotin carboxyl carrier protein
MNKRYVVYCLLLMLVAMATWVFAASNVVEEKSVLSGVVTAEKLAVVGQSVKEGDILICVNTITGTAVAARATIDGTVVEVLVKPDDKTKIGDILVKIDSSRK